MAQRCGHFGPMGHGWQIYIDKNGALLNIEAVGLTLF